MDALICLSSLLKTDSPHEPTAHLGSGAVLLQIIDVLIEWSNWIMVSGNEFSTFGLRHPSQTDSYYLLKDPEARDANYTPRNSPNQMKKKEKETTASHFHCLSPRTGTMPVCMCVWQKEREQERKIGMKQSSPYVKSDWSILAISHRLAYIIGEA